MAAVKRRTAYPWRRARRPPRGRGVHEERQEQRAQEVHRQREGGRQRDEEGPRHSLLVRAAENRTPANTHETRLRTPLQRLPRSPRSRARARLMLPWRWAAMPSRSRRRMTLAGDPELQRQREPTVASRGEGSAEGPERRRAERGPAERDQGHARSANAATAPHPRSANALARAKFDDGAGPVERHANRPCGPEAPEAAAPAARRGGMRPPSRVSRAAGAGRCREAARTPPASGGRGTRSGSWVPLGPKVDRERAGERPPHRKVYLRRDRQPTGCLATSHARRMLVGALPARNGQTPAGATRPP